MSTSLILATDPHEDIRAILSPETTTFALETLAQGRLDAALRASLDLGRVMYFTQRLFTGDDLPESVHELAQASTTTYKSFKGFVATITGNGAGDDAPGRTKCYDSAQAYGQCLEIAQDRGLSLESVWDTIGPTKLVNITRADESRREEMISAALEGASLSEIKLLGAGEQEAEDADIIEEIPGDFSGGDSPGEIVPEPSLEPASDPGDRTISEERVSVTATAGKRYVMQPRDLSGEHDSLRGASADEFGDRAYFTIRLGGVEVAFVPNFADGKIVDATVVFEPIQRG